MYAALFKQGGAHVVTWPPDLFARRAAVQRSGPAIPDVTVDLKNVPFREAFRELQKQTGLRMDDHGREMCLTEERRGRIGAVSPKKPA